MSFKSIKRIAALALMTFVISLAVFVDAQEGGGKPQNPPPKKDPPTIVVQPKNPEKPKDTNKGNEPKSNDNSKPKKP